MERITQKVLERVFVEILWIGDDKITGFIICLMSWKFAWFYEASLLTVIASCYMGKNVSFSNSGNALPPSGFNVTVMKRMRILY